MLQSHTRHTHTHTLCGVTGELRSKHNIKYSEIQKWTEPHTDSTRWRLCQKTPGGTLSSRYHMTGYHGNRLPRCLCSDYLNTVYCSIGSELWSAGLVYNQTTCLLSPGWAGPGVRCLYCVSVEIRSSPQAVMNSLPERMMGKQQRQKETGVPLSYLSYSNTPGRSQEKRRPRCVKLVSVKLWCLWT